MPAPRRTRRPAVLLAIAATAGLALSGCSGSPSTGSPSSTGAGGNVTVQFWNALTGSDKAAVDDTVAQFNKSQSNITVVSTVLPADVLEQKLLSSIASGKGPSTVALDTAVTAQYVSAGALEPVDDFYTDHSDVAGKLVSSAVNATKLNGKSYGVPLNFFTAMLYWNKDLFKKAGLDSPPASWEEFAADAKKLTVDKNGDGTPEQYAIALADHQTLPMYEPFLWNTGGGVVSDDGKKALLSDPATLKALQFWVDEVRKDKVSPIGLGGADADKLFTSGKAAMEIVGPWAAPTVKDAGINFGVARTFAGPTSRTSLAGSEAFGVPTGTPDNVKKAVYTFAAYWNSNPVQARYSSTTGFPSTRTDVTAKETGGNPYPALFGDPTLTANSKVFLAGVNNGSTIDSTVFIPALQKALNGKGSVTELFTAANAQAQALIDKK